MAIVPSGLYEPKCPKCKVKIDVKNAYLVKYNNCEQIRVKCGICGKSHMNPISEVLINYYGIKRSSLPIIDNRFEVDVNATASGGTTRKKERNKAKSRNNDAVKKLEAITVISENIDYLATMPYGEYLQTPHWKKLAKLIKARSGFRCQVCNHPQNLHAHHRTYERRGHELPSDLVCLCDGCHDIFHRYSILHKG